MLLRLILIFVFSGYLNLYQKSGDIVWSSNVSGPDNHTYFAKISDGNFAVYDRDDNNRIIWQTKTGGLGSSAVLAVSDSNYLAILVKNNIKWTSSPRSSSKAVINYTPGSKVLTSDVNMYMIYYGSGWTKAQKKLIHEFSNNIGSSSWYETTKQYYYQAKNSANKIYVNGTVQVMGKVSDSGSLGNSLSGDDLPNLIQNYISNGRLPEDENGVYTILLSKEISEKIRDDLLADGRLGREYCGYHASTQLKSGKRVQYALAGDLSSSPGSLEGCAPSSNLLSSPNGDPGVDAMLSVLAHELTETVTDPIADIDSERAWQDDFGYENADKCVSYGITFPENGYSYNLEMNGRKYMIQENWSPVSQSCVMKP